MKHHGRLKRPLSPSEQAASDHNRRVIAETTQIYVAATAVERERKHRKSHRATLQQLHRRHDRYVERLNQLAEREGGVMPGTPAEAAAYREWRRERARDPRVYQAEQIGIDTSDIAVGLWWSRLFDETKDLLYVECRPAWLDEVEQAAKHAHQGKSQKL